MGSYYQYRYFTNKIIFYIKFLIKINVLNNVQQMYEGGEVARWFCVNKCRISN